jgi:hypothetical protein
MHNPLSSKSPVYLFFLKMGEKNLSLDASVVLVASSNTLERKKNPISPQQGCRRTVSTKT